MSEPEVALPRGCHVFTVEMPRTAFASEADYQRALETSQRPRTVTTGCTMLCHRDQIPAILVALVNNAEAAGMGVLHDRPTTLEEMSGFVGIALDGDPTLGGKLPERKAMVHTDYINGRPIKTNFHQSEDPDFYRFDTWLYNRDQGQGKAERVLAEFNLPVIEESS
jgi:hypothetical protein